MSRRDRYAGAACALLAALGFAGKAIFIRLAYAKSPLDAITLLALRMVFSFPLFAFMSWRARQSVLPPKRVPGDAARMAGLAFLGYYFSTFLDFWGLEYLTAALERVLLFTYPVWVLVLSSVFQGKPAGRRDAAAVVLSIGGIAICFWSDLRFSGTSASLWKGAALILSASITYSVYLLVSRDIVVRLGSLRFAGDVALMAAGFVLAHFFATHPAEALLQKGEIYWLVLWLALLSTALPIYLLVEALRRVGPGTVSVVSSVGPILTILLGAVFLDEPLTAALFVGAALVLAGVILITGAPATSAPESPNGAGQRVLPLG